jgi:uncharacterized membrane protein YccF (DUF307 family)
MPGLEEGFFNTSLGYVLSAVVGIILIFLMIYLSSRFVSGKDTKEDE